MKRGKFIVFEGLDGSGKTAQSKELVDRWRKISKYPVRWFREPGGTITGEDIRTLLKKTYEPEDELDHVSETLLLFASRNQLRAKIEELLANGTDVICDRWVYSTYAYQCGAKNFPVPQLQQLISIIGLDHLVPDVVIYMQYTGEAKVPDDRIEAEYFEFREKMHNCYMDILHSRLLTNMTPRYLLWIERSDETIEQTADVIEKHLLDILK